MRSDKENQEISVLGRLFSLEALVLLMGVVTLVYGLATARSAHILLGASVLAVALLLVRGWRRMRLK